MGCCRVVWPPEVVLVVGVLDVVGVLEVEVGVLGGGVLVVVDEAVVVGAGVQLTPTRVAPAGSDGVPPGGRSTFSVWMLPPSNWIVTTHGSADEADGRAAMPPITASTVIAPTTNFRLRNTVVNLLPRVCSSKSLAPRPLAAWRGRYCLTRFFATVNRRLGRPPGAGQLYSILGRSRGVGQGGAGVVVEAKADLKLRQSVMAHRTAETARWSAGGRAGRARYCGLNDSERRVARAMSEDRGLRDRVVKEGEEAIGKLAQELLENPVVSKALSGAFETRERAMRAQELAMGALNLPSASDLERLTRRIRSVSQRLEGIEDGLDRLEQRIEGLGASSAIEQRLAAIEEKLDGLQKAQPTA